MTTETKVTHTPGPWKHANPTSRFICAAYPDAGEDEQPIAEVCVLPTKQGMNGFDRAEDEEHANAHLIAAAPDMLEALKQIESETLDENAEDRTLEDLHKQLTRILFVAQAAIAKAQRGVL